MSRLTLCPEWPHYSDGVDHQQAYSSSCVLHIGEPGINLFCDFCQKKAACLHITIARPEGQVRRCDVGTMAWDWNGVCLPTIQDAASCQDMSLSGSECDPCSSMPDDSYSSCLCILQYHWTVIHFLHKNLRCPLVMQRQDPTDLQIYMFGYLEGSVNLGYSWRVAE